MIDYNREFYADLESYKYIGLKIKVKCSDLKLRVEKHISNYKCINAKILSSVIRQIRALKYIILLKHVILTKNVTHSCELLNRIS